MTTYDFKKLDDKIKVPDEGAMAAARARWDVLAKPPGSLGRLEELVVEIAGIERTANVRVEKRAHVIFCADNGVLEECVSSNTADVTTFMAEKFLSGGAASAVMCEHVGCDLFVMDIGMAGDVVAVGEAETGNGRGEAGAFSSGIPRTEFENCKIARGTKNIAREPAMTRDEAVRAIETGRRKASELKGRGYEILSAGEMGIGNTTTSAAVISVLCKESPKNLTGVGAGVGGGGIAHKTEVIGRAIGLHGLDGSDPLAVLSCLGGYDLAGLCGFYIGAAEAGIPVVMDGVISAAAALLATALVPKVEGYLVPSHVSKEPAAVAALAALKKGAILDAKFCLGEGTGALALYPLLDLAVAVFRGMDMLPS